MKLSEYLKKYRKENKLTQLELAQKLFVSKQAISKWENDRGLPDISTYPLISELLNVTIDELMGNKLNNKKKKNNIIIILMSIILLLILILIILLFNSDYYRKKIQYKKLQEETEIILNVDLPKIIQYEYISMSSIDGNNYYPINSFYFIFDDTEELRYFEESLNNEWYYDIDDKLEDILPVSLRGYCNNQNQIKIINISNDNEINKLPKEKGKYTFKMYCYQKELNRLIVSTFIYEVVYDA